MILIRKKVIILEKCFLCGIAKEGDLLRTHYIGITGGGDQPKRCRNVVSCNERRENVR